MNTEYLARMLIARTYDVDKTAEPASEYIGRKNPSSNYLDRAESIIRYSSGRFEAQPGFEKILKQEHPKAGYDGAKADEGIFSFSNKSIRNSLYLGRN